MGAARAGAGVAGRRIRSTRSSWLKSSGKSGTQEAKFHAVMADEALHGGEWDCSKRMLQ